MTITPDDIWSDVAARPWPPEPTNPQPDTSVEACRAAAEHFAADEAEVENDRGQVDWERTIERIESWYHLYLPLDGDAEQYRVIRAAIRKARRNG